jgi:hypothetical protein
MSGIASAILKSSESAVRHHIVNIMQKRDAVNRTHVAAMAMYAGIIPVTPPVDERHASIAMRAGIIGG